MDQAIIKRYAVARKLAMDAKESLDKVTEEVLSHLNEQGLGKYQDPEIGTFSVVVGEKWIFGKGAAKRIEELKEDLKSRIQEIEDGDKLAGLAKREETKTLRFQGTKI
jgi:hypothetical protein